MVYIYNFDQRRAKREVSHVDTTPYGVETPTPLRGMSFPSGERQGPAAPGEDMVSCPDQKCFLVSTAPENQGQKR